MIADCGAQSANKFIGAPRRKDDGKNASFFSQSYCISVRG
jgi:hypothetical protein